MMHSSGKLVQQKQNSNSLLTHLWALFLSAEGTNVPFQGQLTMSRYAIAIVRHPPRGMRRIRRAQPNVSRRKLQLRVQLKP